VTTRVSTTAVNAQVAGASRQPSASADGRFVAFTSTATTLVTGDGNGSSDIFVKDTQTGAVTRVSVATGGRQGVAASFNPTISDDGSRVAFVSDDFTLALVDGADDLKCTPQVLPCTRAFVRTATGVTFRPGFNSGLSGADAIQVLRAAISGDGHSLVLETLAGSWQSGPTGIGVGVLPLGGQARWLKSARPFVAGRTSGRAMAISRNGRTVAACGRLPTEEGQRVQVVDVASGLPPVLMPPEAGSSRRARRNGGLDLFYLLQNPGLTAVTATITYFRPSPLPPLVRTYPLPPLSRTTIWVDDQPGLASAEVSARIEATGPILAERAMYLSRPGEPFAAATAGAGIPAPATQWFVAEGATGSFFDLYFLIGNPSMADAIVEVISLLPDGTTVTKTYDVAPQSRRTISVDGEDPRLAETSVAATITSTNGVPIVAERAMWWPSPDWYEGATTAATTRTAQRWAMAGGLIGSYDDMDTYLLIANPSTTTANVTITVGVPQPIYDTVIWGCKVTVAVPAMGVTRRRPNHCAR
jgi:hypothetical protein